MPTSVRFSAGFTLQIKHDFMRERPLVCCRIKAMATITSIASQWTGCKRQQTDPVETCVPAQLVDWGRRDCVRAVFNCPDSCQPGVVKSGQTRHMLKDALKWAPCKRCCQKKSSVHVHRCEKSLDLYSKVHLKGL